MASAAAAAPTRAEVLALFRSLLRTGRRFSDYNIREYTKRRTIDAFRHNQNLSDPSSVSTAYSDGKSQLEIAQRQALVYQLYAPKIKNVMEIKTSLLNHWIEPNNNHIFYVVFYHGIFGWYCLFVIILRLGLFSLFGFLILFLM